jgi:integrase
LSRPFHALAVAQRLGISPQVVLGFGEELGLRAFELCDLQWQQVELAAGRLHVRRVKSGTPSVHPLQGDELRALRRLQRDAAYAELRTATLARQKAEAELPE